MRRAAMNGGGAKMPSEPLHTGGVTGSIPVAPTRKTRQINALDVGPIDLMHARPRLGSTWEAPELQSTTSRGSSSRTLAPHGLAQQSAAARRSCRASMCRVGKPHSASQSERRFPAPRRASGNETYPRRLASGTTWTAGSSPRIFGIG